MSITPKDLAQRLGRLSRAQKLEILANGGRAYGNVQLATWDMIVNVSAMMEGEWKDWPSNITDELHRAIEQQCKARPGFKAKVIYSACKRDEDGPYIQMIVMEMPVFEN